MPRCKHVTGILHLEDPAGGGAPVSGHSSRTGPRRCALGSVSCCCPSCSRAAPLGARKARRTPAAHFTLPRRLLASAACHFLRAACNVLGAEQVAGIWTQKNLQLPCPWSLDGRAALLHQLPSVAPWLLSRAALPEGTCHHVPQENSCEQVYALAPVLFALARARHLTSPRALPRSWRGRCAPRYQGLPRQGSPSVALLVWGGNYCLLARPCWSSSGCSLLGYLLLRGDPWLKRVMTWNLGPPRQARRPLQTWDFAIKAFCHWKQLGRGIPQWLSCAFGLGRLAENLLAFCVQHPPSHICVAVARSSVLV